MEGRDDHDKRAELRAAVPQAQGILPVRKLVSRTALQVLLAAAFVLAVIPVAWTLSTSLKPLDEIYAYPPNWIPRHAQWSNYVKAWTAAPFARYSINSIVVTVSIIALQTSLASLSAYAFSKFRFPGRDLLFFLFLATMMVPTQVVVVPTFIMLSKAGMLNHYGALILPFAASAFGTFLLRQSFLEVHNDLVDAARIDGAGDLSIIRNVMVPMSKPAYVSFILLTFTWRWNDYFWPLIMTSSPEMRTLPVGLVFLRTSEGSIEWNVVMAASVFVILPIIILFLLFQRYFVEGIMSSGVKG
jgi:ABC-type glycerol-3-phosphate transport system permease component